MITFAQYKITECSGCTETLEAGAWVVEDPQGTEDQLLWHPTECRPMMFGQHCKGRMEARERVIHYVPTDEEINA